MLVRASRAGVLLFLLVSARLAAVGGPQETFSAEDYGKIVSDYMEGNHRSAALALADVSTDEQESAIEVYREKVIHESHVKAALLLHTEVVLWTHRDAPFHLRKARGWMGELDAYRRRPFEKSWFLTLGYFYMMSLDPETRPTLEAAASVFPNDIDILLALGTWQETAGWMGRDANLVEEAKATYRDILAQEPEMAEALVRTGRVLKLLDQEEEALPYLERGVDTSGDPAVRFAALLTSGDIHRERGDLAKAIECYRSALDLAPASQSAVVALSHALHESGDTARSYEMVHAFFVGGSAKPETITGPREENDLWWRYLLGHSDRLNSLLMELRKEVQQ